MALPVIMRRDKRQWERNHTHLIPDGKPHLQRAVEIVEVHDILHPNNRAAVEVSSA